MFPSALNFSTIIVNRQKWIVGSLCIYNMLAAQSLSVFCSMMQVIELQLPSFFNNFDPRAAAANFPSSNKLFYPIVYSSHVQGPAGLLYTTWPLESAINFSFVLLVRCSSVFGWTYICISCITLQHSSSGHLAWICCIYQGTCLFTFVSFRYIIK